jgi:fructokinase
MLWGIDLGGTKIECAVLDNNNNLAVVARKRISTEAHKGYEHILGQIKKIITEVSNDIGYAPQKIGFATPGILDPLTNTMKNCNTVCMNGKPMKDDLEAMLGITVSIANDANCFALAEATMGAAPKAFKQPQIVFGAILGTGVGGGVVINGKILTGRQGIAGEWGHNLLDPLGDPCYCGKAGCNEQVFAGPALERFYKRQSGTEHKLSEILALHKAQTDPHATATIERLLDGFAQAISMIINVIDPDVIVLGGGVSNIDLLYTEGYSRILPHIFNNRLDTLIVPPLLGDSAGVFGAACLVNGEW